MILLALASSLSGYLGAMGAEHYFEDKEVKKLRTKKKAKKVIHMWVTKRNWSWGKPVVSSHSTDGGIIIDMSFVPFRDK